MSHRFSMRKPRRTVKKKTARAPGCWVGEKYVIPCPTTDTISAVPGHDRYAPGSVYSRMQPNISPQRVYGYTRGLTRTETFPSRDPSGDLMTAALNTPGLQPTGRGYFGDECKGHADCGPFEHCSDGTCEHGPPPDIKAAGMTGLMEFPSMSRSKRRRKRLVRYR